MFMFLLLYSLESKGEKANLERVLNGDAIE